MEKRDELFAKFGPLLIEAMVEMTLENINVLRKEQGMHEISKDDYLTQLLNHVSELNPYDWMLEEQ